MKSKVAIIQFDRMMNDFDNLMGLQQDQNDFGDWILKQGGTSSFATGPDGDHTTGFGTYYYVESSGAAHPDKVFKVYTPTFDISTTPGKVLSFFLLENFSFCCINKIFFK